MSINLKLRVGSTNYVKVFNLKKASGVAITTVTTSTAKLCLASDGTEAAITGSSISLSAVSGETNAYDGSFPSTVSLTSGTIYRCIVTIVADGITNIEKRDITASIN